MNISPFYRRAPFTTRAFLRLRWSLTPYSAIAAEFPASGRILDLGCGHGLLTLALALGGREREVVAIDHDSERIGLARSAMTAAGVSDRIALVRGSVIDLSSFDATRFDAVAMIDLLHYFSPDAQESLVGSATRLLTPTGLLVVREVDPEKGVASRWTQLYERVATLSGFTRTAGRTLTFRSSAAWIELFKGMGLTTTSAPCGSRLFSDRLYVARR